MDVYYCVDMSISGLCNLIKILGCIVLGFEWLVMRRMRPRLGGFSGEWACRDLKSLSGIHVACSVLFPTILKNP